MNSPCVHCGLSIRFEEHGTFFMRNISLDQTKPFSPFVKMQKDLVTLEYTDLEVVEQLALTLQEHGLIHVECGVSMNEHATTFMDLPMFLKRIRNRDTVEFIQNGQLISHLQPILNLQNGELYGYEALLRSKDSEKNISPFQLFEVANSTGLHSLLDQRAREEAIKAKKNYVEPGIKSFINFLPSTIYNPEFCLRHTFSIVNKYDVDPKDLVFEVVETEKIQDINHLKSVFKTYKREGMKVALDDVGAGFSTIEILKLLEPDYVKIDRSYISFCDQDQEKQQFLNEVYRTSHDLGIKVLAEGVERVEELNVCQQIGFDLCQGYLFGKPSAVATVPDVKAAFAL